MDIQFASLQSQEWKIIENGTNHIRIEFLQDKEQNL